ncbi:hypothetical protein ACH4E7_25105 [Kitasatospora sp. NPDC018058]|uniref:hypothetical protein n=1 Tax=Kitasatospora sp. NPDC018058 TaxID=3364025 RepID=UPI0037BF043E
MSKVADLQKAQQATTHPGSSFYVGTELFDAINKALAVAGPTGAPATIRERAKAYAETAKAYGKASTDLATVATDKLANAWTGSVAEHATQAIQALANELAVSQKTLEQTSTALNAWADDLEGAQSTDAQGMTALENVQKSLAHDIFDTDKAIAAIEPANTAVATRISAARRAESSGGRAASALNQLAAKAGTERAGQGSLDPLAALGPGSRLTVRLQPAPPGLLHRSVPAGPAGRWQQALPGGGGGLGDKGTRLVVDQNLAATGDTYENVSLKTDDDRRAALVRIEKALDEGKPVPLATGDGTGFHEMVITARDGDRLQVWNPWGWSEWVTEDQFIHSHLNDGRLTNDSHLDKAYGVELPR